MTQKTPSNTNKTKPTDQPIQPPTYPAGQCRKEPDDTENKRSQKQPGQDLHDPQKEADDGE